MPDLPDLSPRGLRDEGHGSVDEMMEWHAVMPWKRDRVRCAPSGSSQSEPLTKKQD
jgi:hypothetical protein